MIDFTLVPDIERRLSPAAKRRPQRAHTTQLTIHRWGSDDIGFGHDDLEAFFLGDPEGVATVTISGPYRGKLHRINTWRRVGVPDDYKARAFVPYHLSIADDGSVAQWLPWLARGAHDRYSNRRAIANAVLGDFRDRAPSSAQLHSLRDLMKWMMWDHDFKRFARIDQGVLYVRGHDEELVNHHESPKGCPGDLLPYAEIAEWAQGAANIIDQGFNRF